MNSPNARNRRLIRLPLSWAVWCARLASKATRLRGGGATTIPGKLLLQLRPSALHDLAARSNQRIACVSATNGKTTVTAMLNEICNAADIVTTTNMAGANLRSGVATTFLAKQHSDLLLLEVDEAALPSVVADVQPDVVVLGNLFRDQLDRYGELESLADRWNEMLATIDQTRTTIVYNADDPLISELIARFESAGGSTLSFGLGDESVAALSLPHAADSTFCRRCGAPLQYAVSFVGHLGSYTCTTCDFTRPEPAISVHKVLLHGLGASEVSWTNRQVDDTSHTARIRIPGLYNVYNAAAATSAATALAIPADTIIAGLANFSPAFGRFERIPIPNLGTLTLLLVKNPTGLNEIVRTLVDAKVDLTALLFALNDGIADGRDTSWIWDADIEPMRTSAPYVIATGDRAAEFALRAQYGGWPADHLHIEYDLEDALFEVLERAKTFTTHGHAYALVTYTAMLRMRDIVRDRGWVSAYWEPGSNVHNASIERAAVGLAER